jgi:hypothetical protein
VIRNDQGDVVKVGAGRKEFLMDALHSEMVACLMGVQVAAEMGITKVQVETDSMLPKMALDSNTSELAATGGIVFKINNLFNVYFDSCSVSYCPRVHNRVAHTLAVVTPGFKGKSECKNTCAPGSIYTHASTQ